MYIYWVDQKVQSGFLVRYYIPTHLPIIPGVGGKEKTKLLVTMTIYYRCREYKLLNNYLSGIYGRKGKLKTYMRKLSVLGVETQLPNKGKVENKTDYLLRVKNVTSDLSSSQRISQFYSLTLSNQDTILTPATGFPGGSVVKNPPANAGDTRDTGSISGL